MIRCRVFRINSKSADEKIAAQKEFKTAITLKQRKAHPEKLVAAQAKMKKLGITATDNLESKDQVVSNADSGI